MADSSAAGAHVGTPHTPHHHLGAPPAPTPYHKPILVLKVGTSSLVDPDTQQPKISYLSRICEVTASLQRAGFSVVIVSSGAVGLGAARMGLKQKPAHLSGKQAAAAIGQVRLMSLWDMMLSTIGGIPCAQCLLSAHDFGDRTLYLNARNTLVELLKLGAVPIINENDTTAVVELRVGDNDTLSALVAAMLSADCLFLFTDVDSLFDANPREDPTAAPIRTVPAAAIAGLRRQMLAAAPKLSLEAAVSSAAVAAAAASSSSAGAGTSAGSGSAGTAFGTGGMATKLKAAQLASAAGVTTVITHTNRIEEIAAALVKLMPPAAAAASQHHHASSASAGAIASPAPVAHSHSHGGIAMSGATGSAMRKSGSSSGNLDQKGASPSPSPSPLPSPSPHTPAVTSSAGVGTASFLFSSSPFSFGTSFLPYAKPISGRKRWILALPPAGQLLLDAGAVAAVVDARKSLFPAGIKEVRGDFESQVDAVSLMDETGTQELARALVNFSAEEVRKIKGKRSKEAYQLLGYPGAEAVADRDNIVLLTLHTLPISMPPLPPSASSSAAAAHQGTAVVASAVATCQASVVASAAPTPSM